MYEIITLSTGLKVVMENIPHVKSVTIGVWIGAGSCFETRVNNGISHFIEHMLFKGTKNRTAKQIAEEIDDIGGQLNAFTSKDCTCYYAKVLYNHLDTAVDVLSDMLFNSVFNDSDMELEKNVVLEEINMYNDTPDELIMDLLAEKAWQGNALSYPILGRSKSLFAIRKSDIEGYMSEHYTLQNSVLSVVGNFDRENLIEMLENKFTRFSNNQTVKKLRKPTFKSGRHEVTKDIEQTHLCIGYNSIERGHDLSYPLMVVNTVLGNGMSSKLFQNIREQKGLVYSIYSYQSTYQRAGMYTIYAGMNAANLDMVTQLVLKEIDDLKDKGLTEKEVNKSKEQLKGNLILGLESTSSRMNTYGQSLLLTNKIKTLDEMIEKIDSVNVQNVKETIDLIFNNPIFTVCKGSKI